MGALQRVETDASPPPESVSLVAFGRCLKWSGLRHYLVNHQSTRFEASIFQFMDGSSHSGARGPKLPHEGCLAWKSLSGFVFACEDVSREQVQNLLVFRARFLQKLAPLLHIVTPS